MVAPGSLGPLASSLQSFIAASTGIWIARPRFDPPQHLLFNRPTNYHCRSPARGSGSITVLTFRTVIPYLPIYLSLACVLRIQPQLSLVQSCFAGIIVHTHKAHKQQSSFPAELCSQPKGPLTSSCLHIWRAHIEATQVDLQSQFASCPIQHSSTYVETSHFQLP